MTIAEFYERHAIDGRATVERRGQVQEPPTWISRARYRRQSTYWLCRRDDIAIQLLDPSADAEKLDTACDPKH